MLLNKKKMNLVGHNWGKVGQYMNNIRSDFDSRNYGYANPSGLIKYIDTFEFTLDNVYSKN